MQHNENDPANTGISESPVSITQRIADDLRQRIIHGKIQPGEKLKVESLKTLLNTGTTPIREALSLLTSDQLVERIDQRGFRVAPASARHFREILTLRCQLDVIALQSSAERGNAEWKENVAAAHLQLEKASRKNTEHWESLHKAFHMALLGDCDSPILLRFCEQLYDLNIRYRFLAVKSVNYAKRNIRQEHKAIMQAAIEGKAELAASLLTSHYTLTGDFLEDQFD